MSRYPDGCATDAEHYRHKQRGLKRPTTPWMCSCGDHVDHPPKESTRYSSAHAGPEYVDDLATPPPVPAAPPTEGDEQRRCWQILGPEPISQCALYNGHDGDHWFGEAVPAAPSLDVERLARWLHEKIHNLSPDTFADDQCDCRTMAAEFARLHPADPEEAVE